MSQIWDKLNSIFKWIPEVKSCSEGKPLCNLFFQPTAKNHITIFPYQGRDHQLLGFLPGRNPNAIKILKTAEHFRLLIQLILRLNK